MKSYLRLLAGLLMLAGLEAGCSDSNGSPLADMGDGDMNVAEEVVAEGVVVSDELTPQEFALVRSGEVEAEAESASRPDTQEEP